MREPHKYAKEISIRPKDCLLKLVDAFNKFLHEMASLDLLVPQPS